VPAPAAPPRILLVDDDPDLARLVATVLAQHGFGTPEHVLTAREGLERAAAADVVLLDHQLPDGDGLALLDALHARPEPPAVIMITGNGNAALAAAALRHGAEDYLVKDASLPTLLPQIVERVRRVRDLGRALAAAERDLLAAERHAAVGEMTVTLHHEINNPLMSASAEVELLLAGGDPLTGTQREALAQVRAQLGRIGDILRRARELRQASSTDYLAGIRMIDLAAGAAAPREHRGTAVMYLPDEELARVASLLLRREGFGVRRCESPSELDRWAGALGVTLVVLQGSGTPGEDPLGGFRPPADRGYRLVVLVRGAPERARAAGADLALALPFDPLTFGAELVALTSSPAAPSPTP